MKSNAAVNVRHTEPLYVEFEVALTAELGDLALLSFEKQRITWGVNIITDTGEWRYVEPLVQSAWNGFKLAMRSKRWRQC